jgi:hypothetical protein
MLSLFSGNSGPFLPTPHHRDASLAVFDGVGRKEPEFPE